MQLSVFKFQSEKEQQLNELTTVEIDGEIWFIATQVCQILEIKNVSDTVSRLDEDEKLTSALPIAGQNRKVNLISESGLYGLIFRSRKDSAQQFRKWVTKEVIPSIRQKGFYGKINRDQLPNFYLRYKENVHKIDRNYFSVISELFVTMNSEFEKLGYEIPDKGIKGQGMYPDISVGKMFSSYLKKIESPFNGSHKFYDHSFPDARPAVQARMYPLEVLPTFRKFVFEKWIPENAQKYFEERDPKALDYLPKLIG